jgi:hypothetical protein
MPVVFTAVCAADECSDFCVQQLGSAACSRGSWCKNNRDCHSLFWTTTERSRICVFPSLDGNCKNEFLVLCSEARERTQSGITTSVPLGRSATPGTNGKTSTTTTTPGINGETSTTTTTTPVELKMNAKAVIQLGYHSSLPDERPRVNVKFVGSNQDQVFSLLFDTGSEPSHIVRANAKKPASLGADAYNVPLCVPVKGQGYIDKEFPGIGAGNRALWYGHDDCKRNVPVIRKVQDVIRLEGETDSFTFGIRIRLTSKMDTPFGGVGLLGAAATSDFAQHAGVFAYMPPIRHEYGKDAGTLIVGDRDFDNLANTYCKGKRLEDIKFSSNYRRASLSNWVVQGSVSVGSSEVRQEVNWLVDTAAIGFFVPQSIYDQVVNELRMKGAIVPPRYGFSKVHISDCPFLTAPTISFEVGIGAQSIVLSVDPSEYLVNYAPVLQICTLNLDPAEVSWSPGSHILGTGILRKLFTVFDSENSRMGFCINRHI